MKLLLSKAKLSKWVVIDLMILGQSANIRQRTFMRYLILLITDKAKALRLSTLLLNAVYIEKNI